MKALEFNSEMLPPAERLSTFRRGASNFAVDAVGDPSAFQTRWRLLQLGDVNVIRSSVSPVHYRRGHTLIEADAQDRIAIHYRLAGTAAGSLNGDPFETGPGCAAVWDLAHPLDSWSPQASELIIVTMPRYLLDEVFATSSYSCVLPPSPELALAAGQARHLLRHFDDVAEEGVPLLGRAMRDLFAVALLPALRDRENQADNGENLLQRVHREIDDALAANPTVADLARRLTVRVAAIEEVVEVAGGLDAVVERRRLLASYRRLSDPGDLTPVALVAWQCGITDLDRFRRRFRSVFRASPNQIRDGVVGSLPDWAGAYHVAMSYGSFLKQS